VPRYVYRGHLNRIHAIQVVPGKTIFPGAHGCILLSSRNSALALYHGIDTLDLYTAGADGLVLTWGCEPPADSALQSRKRRADDDSQATRYARNRLESDGDHDNW
jgi:hypothetical protein